MRVKCKICGGGYDIVKKDTYQVSVPDSGLVRSGPTTWDAADCPHCGCQNLLGKRYDTVGRKKRWL